MALPKPKYSPPFLCFWPKTRSPGRRGGDRGEPHPPVPPHPTPGPLARSDPQKLPVSQRFLVSPVDDFLRPPLRGTPEKERSRVGIFPTRFPPVFPPPVPANPASALPSRSSGAGSPIAARPVGGWMERGGRTAGFQHPLTLSPALCPGRDQLRSKRAASRAISGECVCVGGGTDTRTRNSRGRAAPRARRLRKREGSPGDPQQPRKRPC